MKNHTVDNKFIGSRIKEAREKASLSQVDLAKMIGYESATAISLIESGDRKIKAEDINQMSTFLHHSISYFYGEELTSKLDIKTALRAEKNISNQDRKMIEHLIELAKRKHAGRD